MQKHYRKSPGLLLLPGAQVSFTQLKKQFFLVPEKSLKSKWEKATGAAKLSPTSCPQADFRLEKKAVEFAVFLGSPCTHRPQIAATCGVCASWQNSSSGATVSVHCDHIRNSSGNKCCIGRHRMVLSQASWEEV